MEIAFITPFFIRIETPDLVDSTVWLLPVAIMLMLHPFLRYVSKGIFKFQRVLVFLMMLSSIFGMVVLCFAETMGEWWHRSDIHFNIHRARHSAMLIGLMGFLLMDIGLEVL